MAGSAQLAKSKFLSLIGAFAPILGSSTQMVTFLQDLTNIRVRVSTRWQRRGLSMGRPEHHFLHMR